MAGWMLVGLGERAGRDGGTRPARASLPSPRRAALLVRGRALDRAALPGRSVAHATAAAFVALAAALAAAPATAQSAARAAQPRALEAPAVRPQAAPARGESRSDTRAESRLESSTAQRSATLPSALPGSLDVSRFSFTAPGRVPNARPQAVERSFRFTPSGQTSDRRGVSVGVTARALQPATRPAAIAAAPVELSMLPSGYGVDVAVGWRGFALSTGMSRLDEGVMLGERQGVDVGLSYGRRSWRTSLLAGAEREEATALLPHPEVERYNLGAEGVLRLSEALSITGGVRYRTAPLAPAGLELDREDRSVFLGGAVRF